MNIYIDIETLRSPESHKQELLEEVKANFKAPSSLTKTQAAKDLGLTDAAEIKFTSAGDMIARWEKELAEEKSESVAIEKWEKTSFDPDVAPIACICIGWVDGVHGYRVAVFDCENISEKEMLSDFHSYITSLCTAHEVKVKDIIFTGHNIIKFDLPFIWKRSVINNVETCRGIKWVDAKHGYNCYDTMIAWAGHGKMIGADRLCKLLGIKGKQEGIDGSMVYDTWQTDPQRVISYCHDDVSMVKAIHERLIK